MVEDPLIAERRGHRAKPFASNEVDRGLHDEVAKTLAGAAWGSRLIAHTGLRLAWEVALVRVARVGYLATKSCNVRLQPEQGRTGHAVDTTNAQLNGEAAGDPLRFLELWYREQCIDELHDGGGLSIEAVDGPGWWVSIDLRGTSLEGRTVDPVVRDEGGDQWRQLWSDGKTFTVATSVRQLMEGIMEFRRFALGAEVALWDELLAG